MFPHAPKRTDVDSANLVTSPLLRLYAANDEETFTLRLAEKKLAETKPPFINLLHHAIMFPPVITNLL